ncbi:MULTISPECIES: hypothetical protein [Micromonospora]|uniref:MYXO-CTERM domain-containing protein n=1 Tax=Micromonospora chersina TaxID=47854 RepID=A0A1C6VS02_9ACTN|nr:MULTISPECIES: hypothetical protein [Micromonospora]MCP3784428.1 hypothetical protein [Micromonospora sp. A3M-1-15]GHJ51793.1 hypothetical protein Nm8I071_11000 [Nonomuraea sp. TT08I-71]SCL69138.1 hypothetical protein GA0070603_5009 [Micromonospora chersina]
MAENYTDPSGNTAQFRAFVDSPDSAATAAEAPSRLPLMVGIGVAAVVVVAVIAWLALS